MSNPDDLDDGLLYDYESGDETQVDASIQPLVKADDYTTQAEIEEEEEGGEQGEKKRALDQEVVDEASLSKRQKKLKKSKLHDKKRELAQYEIERKKSIPKSSPDTVVQYFATLIRDNNPDLSALELDELYLRKTDFLSTEKFTEERSLTTFPDFVTQFTKAPRVMVFAMSNIRVADIFRALGGSKNCLKIFAKNKLKDDLASVEQIMGGTSSKKFQNIKYFIVTPTRMEKLIESTDLFFQGKDKLDIILDASYLDTKNNTLINCENTMALCKVLKTISTKKSSVKILLF